MIRKHDIDPLLAKVSLFSSCTSKQLAEISKSATTFQFKAGTVIAKQGELGREFIVIVEGHASVSLDAEIIAKLGPGDFFGEIALLDGGPRTASVIADTDLVVEVMNHAEFFAVVMDVPEITRAVLKGLAARLRATDAKLAQTL